MERGIEDFRLTLTLQSDLFILMLFCHRVGNGSDKLLRYGITKSNSFFSIKKKTNIPKIFIQNSINTIMK